MPTKSLYAIYGLGGFGRGVMPVARAMLQGGSNPEFGELVFVDDKPALDRVNGHRVLTYDQFLAALVEKRVNVAIASSSIREEITARCRADGVLPFSVIAGNAVVMDEVTLGDGAILPRNSATTPPTTGASANTGCVCIGRYTGRTSMFLASSAVTSAAGVTSCSPASIIKTLNHLECTPHGASGWSDSPGTFCERVGIPLGDCSARTYPIIENQQLSSANSVNSDGIRFES
jgi:hypothetical protein